VQSEAGVPAHNMRPLEQDARYCALAESAPDAIVTVDERSIILSVNPATERIFGWSAAEPVGQSVAKLMPEPYRARHETGMARYRATGCRDINWVGVALPGLRKDGTEFPMEVSFGEFPDGNRHIFSGFMRDVSERVEPTVRPVTFRAPCRHSSSAYTRPRRRAAPQMSRMQRRASSFAS
jgi:PAS domain S-box-containing protein